MTTSLVLGDLRLKCLTPSVNALLESMYKCRVKPHPKDFTSVSLFENEKGENS